MVIRFLVLTVGRAWTVVILSVGGLGLLLAASLGAVWARPGPPPTPTPPPSINVATVSADGCCTVYVIVVLTDRHFEVSTPNGNYYVITHAGRHPVITHGEFSNGLATVPVGADWIGQVKIELPGADVEPKVTDMIGGMYGRDTRTLRFEEAPAAPPENGG